MQRAIADPSAYAIEPKVDGVRGFLVFRDERVLETRNRRGEVRDWFRREPAATAFGAIGSRLPILWRGTVLDGELTAGRFSTTMAALTGSKEHMANLHFVVFDAPVLAGVDLRSQPWEARRERLELLARAFQIPYELSPIVEPSEALALDMVDGRLEGIVLKRRDAPYRGGSRSSWSKFKDRGWYEREAWRFERR
jgi:bifunctional non-homologous end joining protein LigD